MIKFPEAKYRSKLGVNIIIFGFLNIYKPTGMTSHDVVNVLRRITKVKQIGHTGTLDPFAQGVLPVCIGKSTKLIEYLKDDKAYIGRFSFGKKTDTYDIEGNVLETFEEKIKKEELEKILPNFENEIEQTPPIYSAIKVNGKKLYDYARKGQTVEIEKRKVFIEKIELKEFNFDEQWANIYIKCSKGTYIRSIANDIGELLNNGCYLSKLERVIAGDFSVETSINLDSIQSIEDVSANLLNPVDYLDLKKQELNETEIERISHGMNIYNRIFAQDETVLLVSDNKILAVAKTSDNGLKPEKVFI